MSGDHEAFILSREGRQRRDAAIPKLRRVVRRRALRRIAGRAVLPLTAVGVVIAVHFAGTLGSSGAAPVGPLAKETGAGPTMGPSGVRQPGSNLLGDGSVPGHGSGPGSTPVGAAAKTARAVRTEVLGPSRDVLARTTVTDRAPTRVRMIGDVELVEALAAAGVRAGVVRDADGVSVPLRDDGRRQGG